MGLITEDIKKGGQKILRKTPPL